MNIISQDAPLHTSATGADKNMNYFVTGATGFIGRFLVEALIARGDATVYVLVRESSDDKVEALRERLGDAGDRVVPVYGDITVPGLISEVDFKTLKGRIDHVFHLAAVYDMNMDDAIADRVNIEGTRHVVEFANRIGGKVQLNHVSSVAVAGGEFVGSFSEDSFDVGQTLRHPYFRSKFESERIVRDESKTAYRIFRPGVVIGHSQTGEIDKIDGPYYFFKAVQKVSYRVPKWLPLLGIEGGRVPIVPVDYVVKAMEHLAHKPGLNGRCFHLVQHPAPTVGELLAVFLDAAHGPEFVTRLGTERIAPLLSSLSKRFGEAMPETVRNKFADTIGVPTAVLAYAWNRSVFDDAQTRRALKGSGIECPDIHQYGAVIWAYWEQYLDINYRIPVRLANRLRGKVALITGASSGIGFATSKKLAMAGAKVILVARNRDKLELTRQVIARAGGEAYVYTCDLNEIEDIDRMASEVLRDFGHVDILINNAGRSIRRAVMESLDRFHDFTRTMQLNYFGALRLITRLLPTMVARKSGHIINVSSIGVLANASRFSAYIASKAALDAFTRSLSAEVKGDRIYTTAIYMPLVRTPMIAPTTIYRYVPTWSPDDAADTVVKAIVQRPKSIATPLGTAASISYALWPKFNDYVLSKGFQLFPSSNAAQGFKGRKDRKDRRKRSEARPTLEQMVWANVFKGEHF